MGELFTTVDKSENQQSGKSKISNIQKSSRKLFEELCEDYFDPKEFTLSLIDNYNKTERVYYSVYSNMIYKLDETTIGNLNSNLENLVEFSGTTEFEKLFPRGTPAYGDKKKIIKIIHKLWDHSQLAENQIIEIHKDTFWDNFEGEKIKIEESIKKEGRKLNRELITLVGIFTAMAFLVFGGLNSLSGIFKSASEGLPVLNMSVVSLLWGICVYNLIYLFMFLVAKLTDNDISTNKDSNDILRRHIIYFSGNAVMLSALYFAAWLYFLKIDFRGWYSRLYSLFGSFTPLLGFVIWVIMVGICIIAWNVYRHFQNKKGTKNQQIEKENGE